MSLSYLNQQQLQAVTTASQYVRVVAGAGSGKTRVLTARIIDLIKEKEVPPYRIYAITFTNKAANEMRQRVEQELGKTDVWLSTFHSLALRILKEDIGLIGFDKNFVVIDDDDQNKIIKKIVNNHDIIVKPEEIRKYIGNKKTDGLLPEDIKEEGPFNRLLLQGYILYQEFLYKNNYFDFDDLLIFSCKLLKNEEIAKKWQKRIVHLLIDEFQDTNLVQYDLMKLLTNDNSNIFIVGDADQTIYSWRGAKDYLFLNFDHDFNKVETIILDQNYRSTQEILNAANNLIKKNSNRIDKQLVAVNGNGVAVSCKRYYDDEEEARKVIYAIKFKIPPTESIAILVRAAYLTRPLELEMQKQQIKYNIIGAFRFFEREEIKDAFAYLRVLINRNDDIALERIINKPRRGIGQTTIDKFLALTNSNFSLYQVIINNLAVVSTNISNRINEFFQMLDQVEKDSLTLTVSEILEQVLSLSAYLENLEEDKATNIAGLITTLKGFGGLGLQAVSDAMQSLSLLSAQDDIKGNEKILISTVHAAKGLEFDNVFVVGLNEGVFPNMRSINEGGIEEERRLAYVAFTRAKKRLFLSSNAQFNFILRCPSINSRFLSEINNAFIPKTQFSRSPSPKIPPQNAKNIWNINDIVNHSTFGKGIVVNIITDELISVKFDLGVKTLLGSHPFLTKG